MTHPVVVTYGSKGGGRQMTVVCISFARSRKFTFLVWVLSPSNISSTGSSLVGLTKLRKCSNHAVNRSVCIQPLLWTENMVPGGAPSANSGFILCLGNITISGTKTPPADMQMTKVDKTPLSAVVRLPTCLLPFKANTFELLDWTVVNPVSSTLNTRCGGYTLSFCTSVSMLKNLVTFGLLKALALAWEVASGLRILGKEENNPCSHFQLIQHWIHVEILIC